jgi:hypothetical protein
LVPTGSISNIYDAALTIDYGRKGFATRGKAEEGCISCEKGIALAMTAFQEAQATADPQTGLYPSQYTKLSNFI